jgi:hypothetical protein
VAPALVDFAWRTGCVVGVRWTLEWGLMFVLWGWRPWDVGRWLRDRFRRDSGGGGGDDSRLQRCQH